MKRCPTCNQTYTDPNLSFCVDDGTPLVPVASEEEATALSPRGKAQDGTGDDDRKVVAYRSPGSYLPPGTETNRRRVWPWVLGVFLAFVAGIVGLSIAAALFIPQLRRANQTAQENSNAGVANTNTPSNQNSRESNDKPANEETNANSPAVVAESSPPTDRDQVLAQLTDIENEWTVANLNADKKKLERILADDYVGPSSEGGVQGKAQYIGTIQRETGVKKWEFEDLKLELLGDRAALSGKITYVIEDREVVFDFKDKFVWRDGRWQATGSEVTRRE